MFLVVLVDYKWARGFDPALIHSVHYFCNPALRRAVSKFFDDETERNLNLSKHLLNRSPVRTKGNSMVQAK